MVTTIADWLFKIFQSNVTALQPMEKVLYLNSVKEHSSETKLHWDVEQLERR